MVQQGTRVDGLLGHVAWSGMSAAAGEATPVVLDEPVVISKGGLRQEWGKGISEHGTVDEQHRLTAPSHLVLQLSAVDGTAIGHDALLRLVPRLRATAAGENVGSGRVCQPSIAACDHGPLQRRMRHCLR